MKKYSPVAIWLLIGVGMIMIQVLLGGITRLTGSGLSITEWKPLLGAIPPMNEQDWNKAFDQYKQIGQYKHINFDFTLSDFKFIYFWEWFHRVWARLMGVVFAVGFVYFIVKKQFKTEMILPMVLLFLLGALQGAIGWIMVQSGLNEDDISVNHIRLAIHFMAALGLLVYVFWFAISFLLPKDQYIDNRPLKKFSWIILSVLIVQLFYGAFMAGLKAGTTAPTWPTINGMWIPGGMGSSITDNPIAVQFIHRGLAYLIAILILAWWSKALKATATPLFRRSRNWPPVLVGVQVILGIFTVLYSPDKQALLWLGVAHQFVAMLLLLSLVWTLRIMK
ncbi:MAG TPA: COX15/CtaA family protein [Chitinophagaceae bacterium]|nr:COX15/CtaA family protein [Chitinophagaceae bacterium]